MSAFKIILIIGIKFLHILSSNFNLAHALTKKDNKTIISVESYDFDDKIRSFMELGNFPPLIACYLFSQIHHPE